MFQFVSLTNISLNDFIQHYLQLWQSCSVAASENYIYWKLWKLQYPVKRPPPNEEDCQFETQPVIKPMTLVRHVLTRLNTTGTATFCPFLPFFSPFFFHRHRLARTRCIRYITFTLAGLLVPLKASFALADCINICLVADCILATWICFLSANISIGNYK